MCAAISELPSNISIMVDTTVQGVPPEPWIRTVADICQINGVYWAYCALVHNTLISSIVQKFLFTLSVYPDLYNVDFPLLLGYRCSRRGIIPGFLFLQYNNQNSKLSMMKFLYSVEFDQLYNMSKYHLVVFRTQQKCEICNITIIIAIIIVIICNIHKITIF